MTTWADQQLLATVLLLIPVTLAVLAVVVHRRLVMPHPGAVRLRHFTPAVRRQWLLLRVPLRLPDLPGNPLARAPGRRTAGARIA